MHIKFNDKEPGSEIPELVESFADIQVYEDHSEPDQTLEFDKSPEAEPITDTHNEEAFDETQDGSQRATQSKNTFKYKFSHPEDLIIGNKESLRRTRPHYRQEESMLGLLLVIEPATMDEALLDGGWILAMQEELIQFQRNDVWDLGTKPKHKNIIGTKWVLSNKINEQGEVVRNKARLVPQG
jgi:hypothetical protein